jgi:hypothetical protein
MTNLIWILSNKWKHSADILHAGHLGAKGSLWVKVTLDEVAVFAGSKLAATVDPNAAGFGSNLAVDVLGTTLK